MYTPFLIGLNLEYGPYAHFGYWTLISDTIEYIRNLVTPASVGSAPSVCKQATSKDWRSVD